ncbi:MAG: PSD1 and planctomycete cytochrome C domain-containing protein [Verrucomicrobia bacterium]|nr:PSD1 and planctomycete cytochrome C domain-containing protein [Verrucomicrobiota bacterium]
MPPRYAINFSSFIFPAAFALAALFAPTKVRAGENDASALKFFETKIRPLLADQCFKCHGERKHKASLRLDNLHYILQGGDSGPALVPKDAEQSLLMKAVSYEDADLQMPPDNKLEPQQIADLKKWINLGAPWPEKEVTQAANRKPGEFSEADRAWWSFQPVSAVALPVVENPAYKIVNPVDRFITAKLLQENLPQSAEASRAELARRIYFDLHGLPPTPEELQAFIADKEPDAKNRLINKLLESPRYGERWAQHWLDLARYGESDGYREDAYRPDAWRYREYVVRSLNNDKPYDLFVREQLAGDEIDRGNPDALIATALLRHTAYEYNQRDAEGQRTTILNEVTDTVGELFLGLSFACARCHDHKFDPILQKDYYRLQAFFAPMVWRDDLPLASTEEIRAYEEKLQKWEAAAVAPRKRLADAFRPKLDKLMQDAVKKFPLEIQAMVNKPDEEKSAYEKQISYYVCRQGIEEQAKVTISKLKGSDRTAAEQARSQLRAFESLKPKPLPVAFAVTDVGRDSPPTTMKTRKDGEQTVEPGFLSILDPANAVITPPENLESSGRRTALANWITKPDNPLTARVIVNRVWQHHFGRGLVATSSDFGHLGDKPSHPELLDWLTHEFVNQRWSLKWLHRTIMNSATYLQTARPPHTEMALKIDPENRWLWRMNPRRLDAEQARDALLAISGELTPVSNAPGVESHQPVRSLYTRKIRNSQDEFLRMFDAPNGFQSTALRDATNTALQGLLMIDGDWPLQRARAMAARLLQDAGPTPDQLVPLAFQLAYSRAPQRQEIETAAAFLRAQNVTPARDQKSVKPIPFTLDPLVDASPFFGKHPLGGLKTVAFRPGGTFEKLRVQTGEMEGESFTVEAVIYLDSIYPDSSVRTIASRWNNEKSSKGWSFGVTSATSKYQPNNLIMQLSGQDDQADSLYEVVASNIRIPLKTPCYVAAVVSNQPAAGHTTGGTVTFYFKNLADLQSPLETALINHPVASGHVNREHQLYIGGCDHDPRSLLDGVVSRVTVTRGTLSEDDLLVTKPKASGDCLFDAQAESIKSTQEPLFIWEKSATKSITPSAQLDAVTDFCHALINSNEFLYLH